MSELVARIKEAVTDRWDALSSLDKTRISAGALGLAVGFVLGALLL